MPINKKPTVAQMVHKTPLHRASATIKLWSDDRKNLTIKLVKDNLTLQRVAETLLLEYVAGNLDVKNILQTKLLDGKPRRTNIHYDGLEQDETSKLFDELEKLSPLQDKDAMKPK